MNHITRQTSSNRYYQLRVAILGCYHALLAIVLVYGLFVLWPEPVTSAQDISWKPTVSLGAASWPLSDDARLILIVLCTGALGSYVHAATSFVSYVGNRRLVFSWVWWYVLRPFIGMVLALIFYFVIDTKVKSSFALFLFVGPGYVNSTYCLDELKYFSRLFAGAQDELRNRVWILELEPLSGEVMERFKSRLREAHAENLWTNVRSQLYDARTQQSIPLQHTDGKITDTAAALLRKVAGDLVERIANSTRVPLVSNSSFEQDVVVGAVTEDLVGASKELKAQLQTADLKVDSVPDNALTIINSPRRI
jgi:hypothetical protein